MVLILNNQAKFLINDISERFLNGITYLQFDFSKDYTDQSKIIPFFQEENALNNILVYDDTETTLILQTNKFLYFKDFVTSYNVDENGLLNISIHGRIQDTPLVDQGIPKNN